MRLNRRQLRKILLKEFKSINEGFVGKIENPSLDPVAHIRMSAGSIYYVSFQGLGPEGRHSFALKGQALHKFPGVAQDLLRLRERGGKIGDSPRLAQYIASTISNLSAQEIGQAVVR